MAAEPNICFRPSAALVTVFPPLSERIFDGFWCNGIAGFDDLRLLKHGGFISGERYALVKLTANLTVQFDEPTSRNAEPRSNRTRESPDSEPRAGGRMLTRIRGTFEPVQEEGQILQTVSAKSSRRGHARKNARICVRLRHPKPLRGRTDRSIPLRSGA
jgi:hypothetical protein